MIELRLLRHLAVALAMALVVPAEAQQSDRGIGGTGMPLSRGDDRGIGGTGYFGTITAFGSIVVNGDHVGLPATTIVVVDGVRRTTAALRVGQVVRVAALGGTGQRRAVRVDVTREVVGPVESVAADGQSLVVLGQTVVPPPGLRLPRPGTRIAVDGLRRPDGTVEASLISPAAGPDQIAGTVVYGADGLPMIGAAKLGGAGLRSGLNGRVVARGKAVPGGLRVERIQSASQIGRVRQASVEAFVLRRSDRLDLGGGLAPRLAPAAASMPLPPEGRPVRAVVDLVVERSGALRATGVRLIERTGGTGGGGAARGPTGAPPGAAGRGGPGGPPGGGPGGGPGSGHGGG
ncbi:MAG: DUF5666 domain-containing protein, partial [Alsobacter sp.]